MNQKGTLCSQKWWHMDNSFDEQYVKENAMVVMSDVHKLFRSTNEVNNG